MPNDMFARVVLLFVAAMTLSANTPAAETKPFSLINHEGKTTTDQDFKGEYMLVHFGYTHCPDVCPTSLYNLAAAVKRLGANGERIRPIFVTVDPERDTVELLASYVQAFHPRMVGLTGSKEQVAEAAKAYEVDYVVSEYKGEYLVHHSAFTYLLGPDGAFLKRFPFGTEPDHLVEAIRAVIN
ncbi:MAG: SCO family protein [Gammaproteobacteria bacterium]